MFSLDDWIELFQKTILPKRKEAWEKRPSKKTKKDYEICQWILKSKLEEKENAIKKS